MPKPLNGEFKVIPKNAALDSALSDRAYRVLGILCEFLNSKTWTCFPSQERMAKLSGKNVAFISRGISELKERGRIVMKKGRQVNASYEIIWKPQPKPPIQDTANMQGLKQQDTANMQGKTRQICKKHNKVERNGFIDTDGKAKTLVKEKSRSLDSDVGLELQGDDSCLDLELAANLPELSDDDAPPERDADDITLDSVFLGFSQFDAKPKKTDSQPKAKPSPMDAERIEKELQERLKYLQTPGGDKVSFISERERIFPLHKNGDSKFLLTLSSGLDYFMELNQRGITTVSLGE